jgi:acyl-CoA hydrolase
MPTLLDTKVESRRLILPAEANAMSTAHGGNVLKWMERTGAMSGMHFCGDDVVTVSFDNGRFHEPIPEGDIALIDAYVYDVGDSSITIRVRCFHDDHESDTQPRHAEATLVGVAVDDDGQSQSVPDLRVETETGKRLKRDAQQTE